MRRRAVVSAVLVYGVAGLVLTVVAAWRTAVFVPFSPGYRVELAHRDFPGAWVPEGQDVHHASVARRVGVAHWELTGDEPPGASAPRFVTNVWRSGLPMVALESRVVWDSRTGGRVSSPTESGILVPNRMRTWAMLQGRVYQSWLPLLPVWPGLVVDAAAWGVLAFCFVRAVDWVRGVWRASRGRCRGCGYPVGGLEACPECGGRSRRMGA